MFNIVLEQGLYISVIWSLEITGKSFLVKKSLIKKCDIKHLNYIQHVLNKSEGRLINKNFDNN